jgi:hypothetical protein
LGQALGSVQAESATSTSCPMTFTTTPVVQAVVHFGELVVRRWHVRPLSWKFSVHSLPKALAVRSDVLRSLTHGSMDDNCALSRSSLDMVEQGTRTMNLILLSSTGLLGAQKMTSEQAFLWG